MEAINKVLYNLDQTADTTEAQKATARTNIGAQAQLTAGSNVSITNNVISATDTTYGVFSTSADGLVPKASGTGDTGKFLKGDGTWEAISTTVNATAPLYGSGTQADPLLLRVSHGLSVVQPVDDYAYLQVTHPVPAPGSTSANKVLTCDDALGNLSWQTPASVPTVNDGVLTIQNNGVTLDTFSANQSGNTTVNLQILKTGGDAGSHEWTSEDGNYVDLVINMPYSVEEWLTRCIIEVGGFRAVQGVSVYVPSNYIDYAEIWLGTASNHSMKQVGNIEHTDTGSNGLDFDNGGYWTMSHLYGDNMNVVDKLTVRVFKQPGATMTDVTTSCKINVIQFK